jgi:hypothetical protein
LLGFGDFEAFGGLLDIDIHPSRNLLENTPRLPTPTNVRSRHDEKQHERGQREPAAESRDLERHVGLALGFNVWHSLLDARHWRLGSWLGVRLWARENEAQAFVDLRGTWHEESARNPCQSVDLGNFGLVGQCVTLARLVLAECFPDSISETGADGGDNC